MKPGIGFRFEPRTLKNGTPVRWIFGFFPWTAEAPVYRIGADVRISEWRGEWSRKEDLNLRPSGYETWVGRRLHLGKSGS